MPKWIYLFLTVLWAAPALCADAPPPETTTATPAKRGVPDSKQMERDLQRLPWKQFRSVIEGVPKMKADVDAYGPAGWKYIEGRYKTHAWKKGIDKLDDDQRQRLSDLIRAAKSTK
jgi:hypothetical protein